MMALSTQPQYFNIHTLEEAQKRANSAVLLLEMENCFKEEDPSSKAACFLMKQMENNCRPETMMWKNCIKSNPQNSNNCNWLGEELLECFKHSFGPLTRLQP